MLQIRAFYALIVLNKVVNGSIYPVMSAVWRFIWKEYLVPIQISSTLF